MAFIPRCLYLDFPDAYLMAVTCYITSVLPVAFLTKSQPLEFSSRGLTSSDSEQVSGPQKSRGKVSCPRCEASCRRLHGTRLMMAVSVKIPSGHEAAACRIYSFHHYRALWVMSAYFPGSRGTEIKPGILPKHKVKAKQERSVTPCTYQIVVSV
jgi:hypothetical protein